MINKIEFSASNLTSNAGLFLLLEQANRNGIFVLINDADLQFVFALQDGLYKGNGLPAANQNLPVEVHFPGRKDHPNDQKRGDETF